MFISRRRRHRVTRSKWIHIKVTAVGEWSNDHDLRIRESFVANQRAFASLLIEPSAPNHHRNFRDFDLCAQAVWTDPLHTDRSLIGGDLIIAKLNLRHGFCHIQVVTLAYHPLHPLPHISTSFALGCLCQAFVSSGLFCRKQVQRHARDLRKSPARGGISLSSGYKSNPYQVQEFHMRGVSDDGL
jgi:hypothetical protein